MTARDGTVAWSGAALVFAVLWLTGHGAVRLVPALVLAGTGVQGLGRSRRGSR